MFNSARKLMIAEIKKGEIVNRRRVTFFPEMSGRLAGALSRLCVDVLISGAISQLPADIVERSGIKLILFVSGNAEEVLWAYTEGPKIVPAFSMPGCGCTHRRRKCRNELLTQLEEVRNMPRGNKTGPQGSGPCTGKGRGGCGSGGKKPGKGRGQGGGSGKGQGKGQGQGRGQGQGGNQGG